MPDLFEGNPAPNTSVPEAEAAGTSFLDKIKLKAVDVRHEAVGSIGIKNSSAKQIGNNSWYSYADMYRRLSSLTIGGNETRYAKIT